MRNCPCPLPDLERLESQWPVWRMVLCLEWIQNPDGMMGLALGAYLILTCLVPLVLRLIRTIMEASGCICNDALKIQTPRSRWCSLTLDGSKHQGGNNVAGRRTRKKAGKPVFW
jgi:hypothetical protein